MLLIRSWPRVIPPGRSYVVDDIPKLVIDNAHYGPLADVGDDALLLEWDIATSKEDLVRFAARARETPDQVLVAPYRIYYEHMLPEPVWAHRRWDGTGSGTVNPIGATPVQTGDPACNLFGLGMAYLPTRLVKQFVADRWSAHFGDVEFSMWHHMNVSSTVPICWEVRPVHLNYLIPTL